MSGWWIPPRWNAAGPGKPPAVPSLPGGPGTGTAPAIRAGSGDCACTWSARCTDLPVGYALTGARADERQTLLSILGTDPDLAARLPGQVIIGDKNYYGRGFEAVLASAGLTLLRPARHGEPERPGSQFFRPLRQIVESVNDTFKGQLDLERHGGHTPAGVTVRILQRILALTAAIWHNDRTGQPVRRSLLAYDH